MVAGRRRRALGCACLVAHLQGGHNPTALLLHRSGGVVSPPEARREFFGRGLTRSWCGMQQQKERRPASLPCHPGGRGGSQRRRTTPGRDMSMLLDFFDTRARSQVCCKVPVLLTQSHSRRVCSASVVGAVWNHNHVVLSVKVLVKPTATAKECRRPAATAGISTVG